MWSFKNTIFSLTKYFLSFLQCAAFSLPPGSAALPLLLCPKVAPHSDGVTREPSAFTSSFASLKGDLQLENKIEDGDLGYWDKEMQLCPSFLGVKFLSPLRLFQRPCSLYSFFWKKFPRKSIWLLATEIAFFSLAADHHPQTNFLFSVQYLKAGNCHINRKLEMMVETHSEVWLLRKSFLPTLLRT